MKKFWVHLKYYLGFPTIIKKDGGYYVVKGLFGHRPRDKTDPQFWWYAENSQKAYSKCATLLEARVLYLTPPIPKKEIIV